MREDGLGQVGILVPQELAEEAKNPEQVDLGSIEPSSTNYCAQN